MRQPAVPAAQKLVRLNDHNVPPSGRASIINFGADLIGDLNAKANCKLMGLSQEISVVLG